MANFTTAPFAIAVGRKCQINAKWYRLPILQLAVPSRTSTFALQQGETVARSIGDVNRTLVGQPINHDGPLVIGTDRIGPDPHVCHLWIPVR